MLTDSSNGLSDARLLALATEELQLELLALIRSVREEFYVTSKDYDVTAEQAGYVLPARASGLVLRDIQLVSDTSIKPLEPIAREAATSTTSGVPTNYYFEHNRVILYPTPAATQDTLRLSYFVRPSALAATTSAAAISAIDTNTNIVTVATIPSSWTTGTIVDFVGKYPPYANAGVDYDIANVSGTDITFSSLPDGLVVGDYIALAEYTPLPQVPQEFQVVLAQMVVCRALFALGQLDQLAAAEAKLEKYKDAAVGLMAPRNEGGQKKVVPNTWSNGRRW